MTRYALSAALTMLPLWAAGGCGNFSVGHEVMLRNASGEATHIFRVTEGFDSSNRVQPGASRTVTVTRATTIANETVFQAGRDGTVLASAQCTVFGRVLDSDRDDVPVLDEVVWDGVSLTCVARSDAE